MSGMEHRTGVGQRIAKHVFTREQIARGEFGPFAAAHSPEMMSPDALREAYDSLVINVSGFEGDPRALYEIPETRAFFAGLHGVWPHAFFFCNLSAADLKSLVFCRLTTLSVERRAGSAPKVIFSKNELFQIIGRDLEPLERICQKANLTGEFRNRSRRILRIFGFLKK